MGRPAWVEPLGDLAAELTDDGKAQFDQIVAEQAKAEREIFEQLDTEARRVSLALDAEKK